MLHDDRADDRHDANARGYEHDYDRGYGCDHHGHAYVGDGVHDHDDVHSNDHGCGHEHVSDRDGGDDHVRDNGENARVRRLQFAAHQQHNRK
jgi:urease accessory protein